MQDTRLAVDLEAFGDNIRRWRKLQRLSAALLAERSGITRNTLRAIETGTGGVRLLSVMSVLRTLGLTDQILDATEPLNNDVARLNVNDMLVKRVR